MSKYTPLADFLKKQDRDFVPMTFADIERVIGARLPPSASKHRPWWSNNPDNSVLTKAWLEAGFESEQVDMAGRRLVFRRVRAPKVEGKESEMAFHPAYGFMKGLVRIMPETDLTRPADPDLADYLNTKYGPEKQEA